MPKTSWHAGKSPAQRGYDYRWRKAREAFLREHPLCAMCKAHGRINQAQVVDHIHPHQGNQKLFWDRRNWQPLCRSHHSSTKQSLEIRDDIFNPKAAPFRPADERALFTPDGRVVW